MNPRAFLRSYTRASRQLLDSVSPDLQSFSPLLAIASALFCIFCVLFSILDFNILLDHVNDRSILKWNNDIIKGKELWKRVIMIISGLASFTNALHLILAAKGRYSTYFWGTIYSVIYGIFSAAYHYGGDFQLQIFINVPLQLVGIWTWRDKFDRSDAVVVRSLGWKYRLGFFGLAFVLGVALFYELPAFSLALFGTYRYPESRPRCIDAASVSLSIVAQILLVGRFWEQWIIWVVVDTLQVVMYSGEVDAPQNVNILIMFILYLLNSIFGLWVWLKRYKNAQRRAHRKLDRKSRRSSSRRGDDELREYKTNGVSVSISDSSKHHPRKSLTDTVTNLSSSSASAAVLPPPMSTPSLLQHPTIDRAALPPRGLVIGKFWPPHNGHLYLLDYALANCTKLHIIVCERHDRLESPSGALRQSWLSTAYPTATVHLIADHYDQDDSALWASLTKTWLGFTPSIVFTSETYGEAFCRYLPSTHICVDLPRLTVPISGTLVRSSPLTHWSFLPSFTRAHYALRICLLGPESTGKTTLCAALARHFETTWVPEYGRDVTVEKLDSGEYVWSCADFTHIGVTQSQREDAAAAGCNRILFCDTDALATTVWHQRYRPGFPVPAELEEHVKGRPVKDLYLLTTVGTKPFVQDGTRDGEAVRTWMEGRFREVLESRAVRYKVLEGGWEGGVEFGRAVEAVNELLRERWEGGVREV